MPRLIASSKAQAVTIVCFPIIKVVPSLYEYKSAAVKTVSSRVTVTVFLFQSPRQRCRPTPPDF